MSSLLLGVGNRLSHDDGVGPMVAESLEGSSWCAVDCGTSLENAAGIVARECPDCLVIVDAARMALPPGSIRRFQLGSVDRMLGSTHGLPLGFVLERLGEAAGQVVLVGVEPADLSFGEGLSPCVAEAARTLADLLRRGELQKIPELEVPTGT